MNQFEKEFQEAINQYVPAHQKNILNEALSSPPVSYTHLTLPTSDLV